MTGNTPLDRTDLVNVHLRILLIEDNEDDFILFKQLLSKSQFLSADLLWAKGIRESLPIIAAGNLDLILTDLTLPDGNGVETITKLNEVAKKIPIVVLTSNSDERLALYILRAGARIIIKDKFSTYDLVRSIRYSIERKALVAELQESLDNIKTLKGLLPICASCKKIRNDQGYWKTVETYLQEHSNAQFTHGLCPQCVTTYLKTLE